MKAAWYNQGIDQAPFVTATGAAYHALLHPDRMATALRDAFVQAKVERRPVVAGIPFDLQNQPLTADIPTPSAALLLPGLSPIPPHPDDMARAVSLITKAGRIVAIAGMGAVEAGAGPACRRLAARCGDALLATTLPARGPFHEDPCHPHRHHAPRQRAFPGRVWRA